MVLKLNNSIFIKSLPSSFMTRNVWKSGINPGRRNLHGLNRIIHEDASTDGVLADVTISKLGKALLVLKLGSFENIALNAEKLHNLSRKVIGNYLTNSLLKHTFYEHFVAGENDADLLNVAGYLHKKGAVHTMLCPPMEDLHGESSNFESMARSSTDRYLNYLDLANKMNNDIPGHKAVMQYKLSAVFPKLSMDNVSKNKNSARDLFQVSDYCRNVMSGAVGGSDGDMDNFMVNGLKLSAEIFQRASNLGIAILIDAELHSSHFAMYAISLAAMALHNPVNSPSTNVYSTFQCYFKDTLDVLNKCLEVSKQLNARLGCKCVRGAYMKIERELAAYQGYPDPVYKTYEQTSISYDDAVSHLLHEHRFNPGHQSLFVASHNLISIQSAVEIMDRLNIPPNDGLINFATIYGFCNHISHQLGTTGYNVYKSVPWGKVDEWVPYLARRAAENHTALQTARNEYPLYTKELKKRFFSTIPRKQMNVS